MSDFILWYLSVGLAIYIIFFVRDMMNGFEMFHAADWKSVIRGLFLIIFWPGLPWFIR